MNRNNKLWSHEQTVISIYYQIVILVIHRMETFKSMAKPENC